ncbi:hypothetical protein ABTE16_20415, partial [Acinetobacter baumannii]
EEIARGINLHSGSVRRAFVRRVATLSGPSYVLATTEPTGSVALDCSEPVTDRKVWDIARRILRDKKVSSQTGRKFGSQPPADPKSE